MNKNTTTIIWQIKEIKVLTPKGFGVFKMELDKTLEKEFPSTIYPIKWDKYILVKGFVWKDHELLEWYNIRIQWKFEPRNEQKIYGDPDYTPKLEFNIEFWTDIELIGWLGDKAWLSAYMIRYIPWIGESQVKEIFKTFKEDEVVKIFDSKNAIKELQKVKWIGEIKAQMIKEAWDEWKVERDIMIDLGKLWLSINKCWLIYKTWGAKYKQYLDEDPYRLTEIKGIWFAVADEVAMKYLNIWKKDPRRYAWIIEYIIRKYAEDKGDTIISADSIKEWIKDFISDDPDFTNNDINDIYEKGIESALEKNTLYKVNDKVYSLWYYAFIETRIFKKIKEGKENPKQIEQKEINFLNTLKWQNILTKEQFQAVNNAFEKRISIILGWAWTWKTFTVWKIIEWLRQTGADYAIITPTNKAKARVKEVNPHANVETIHSLLKIIPWEEPEYNKDNQLPQQYLIIDETSMVDNNIAKYLLEAINFKNTTVIFVWDPQQLPPVWFGSFFSDIINSWFLEENITYLSEVKRASDKEYDNLRAKGYDLVVIKEGIHNIVANSLRILEGQMPIDTKFDCLNYFSDFSNKTKLSKYNKNKPPFSNIANIIEELENEDNIDLTNMSYGDISTLYKLKTLILWLIKRGIDVNKDFQIYAPVYKSNLWIVKLNRFISDLINKNEIVRLDKGPEFKVGEKVMFSENNKDLELTKGDIWIIKSIEPWMNVIYVDFYWQWIKEIKGKDLDSLEFWYVISVHKAQGTEIKYWAIIMTWAASLLLSNQLFYTAYTRMKEKVFLLGDENAYKHALKTHINVRNTLLYHFLANTPLDKIYPVVSRKEFWISANELKQIKLVLSEKYQLNHEETKIIKINYADNWIEYKFYRYLFWKKEILNQLELIEWKDLHLEDIEKIENAWIKFLRIKKYTSPNEKRGVSYKIVKNEHAHIIEINSYNKDINII